MKPYTSRPTSHVLSCTHTTLAFQINENEWRVFFLLLCSLCDLWCLLLATMVQIPVIWLLQTLVNHTAWLFKYSPLASESETPTNAYALRSAAKITDHDFSSFIFHCMSLVNPEEDSFQKRVWTGANCYQIWP